ncbi:MAG: 3-hydroxyacyl-CoA dehydrogenase [Deltaproteobacteria bacterium]|nr:3-hydroxyacyl-CoA dehydrogenase [Deltaproteobacteria bacterium]
MELEDIKKVLIIGAGAMGQQIGFQCAIHGFEIALYDVAQDVLDKALIRLDKLAGGFVAAGKLSQADAKRALDRIEISTDAARAAGDADLVSESVPEDPDLKSRVFAQFNALCPERTVFTTNTSSLLPSMLAEATGRPDRFAAFHFHDIRFTRIVDIMPHPGTAPKTVTLIKAFADKIGQVALVLKKENPGYLFNAMFGELAKAAQTLAAGGVASVEDIDRAWMGVMNAPIGPFGIIDSIGLDTVLKVTDYWAEVLQDPQMKKNADFVRKYVEEGKLGTKIGRGFYEYPNPAFVKPGFIDKKEA